MTADQSPLFPRASTGRLRTVLAARLPGDAKWAAWIDGVVEELVEGAHLNALGDRLMADGYDEDDTEVILQRVEEWLGEGVVMSDYIDPREGRHDQTHYLGDGCQPPHMMASEPPVGVRPPVAAARPQGIDREEAWGIFRDGPDYQSTDRYDARGPFDAGWDAALALVRPAWVPAQPSTSGAVWVPEPLPPLPHDWRHGEIDTAGRVTRVAVSVCWACEAVAWNEPDFLALDPRPCPGHPEVALVREAFAAHPEWFASDSARRRIAELLKVPT